MTSLARALARLSRLRRAPGPQRALTLAAMALPGMALAVQPEDAQLQYSSYQEGGLDVWRGPDGTVKAPDPIEVDSLRLGTAAWLTDRLKLAFTYLQDTWSGATPLLTAPEAFLTVSGASVYPRTASLVDGNLTPYGPEHGTGTLTPQPERIHMLSSASAETRRQADFTLTHEWDDAGLDVSLGVSDEPDFTSHFGSIGGRLDFNQKLTTLTAGLGITKSDVDARLGPVVAWTDYGHYVDAPNGPKVTIVDRNGQRIQNFSGERNDWSASVGMTQVLGRNSTVTTGLTYTHTSGFMENPYKLVMVGFADPEVPIGGLFLTRLYNVPEDRPETRDQWTWNASLSHFFADLDGALHLDYRFSDDDWGITSHTLEASWNQGLGTSWMVMPRIRYYSQEAADFYRPYFVFSEAAPVNPDGGLDFDAFPIERYASDQRLSAYGALSGGLMISKRFAPGISLEGGVEYYVHDGNLKLGGGGEGAYTDFHYYTVNLGLKVDLGVDPATMRSMPAMTSVDGDDHADHMDHAEHAGHDQPGGLMYAHVLNARDFMIDYRYMHDEQSGSMRSGTHHASDAEIAANGCIDVECTVAPREMTMNMHMVDVMYAPTGWLTLMTMFQFMDMEMKLRVLEGSVVGGGGEHHHGAGHDHHTTAGIGDTVVAGLVKLIDNPGTDIHAGLGVSIPTGEVDIKMVGGEYQHYGMQTGSGTWDLQPSVTYTARAADWSWGGQVSGVIRTGGHNKSGYKLGNIVQSTAWTTYRVRDWLSASLRGVYTKQGFIYGQFDPAVTVAGPMDTPDSYGGRFVDVGLGLSTAVPGRSGDRLTLEWLEPVSQNVNGYQLDRNGNLAFSWTFMF